MNKEREIRELSLSYINALRSAAHAKDPEEVRVAIDWVEKKELEIMSFLDQEIGKERERILEWAKSELEERKKGLEIWRSGENPSEPMEIWGNIWELERVIKKLT